MKRAKPASVGALAMTFFMALVMVLAACGTTPSSQPGGTNQGSDLLNHHNVSPLDLAHVVDVPPGAVAALVAGLTVDEELAALLLQGLEELVGEDTASAHLNLSQSEDSD